MNVARQLSKKDVIYRIWGLGIMVIQMRSWKLSNLFLFYTIFLFFIFYVVIISGGFLVSVNIACLSFVKMQEEIILLVFVL